MINNLHVGSPTPWGPVQHVHTIAPGVVQVMTESHGGIYVAPDQLAKIPRAHQDFAAKWSKGWGPQWFEEDLAALAVLLVYGDPIDEQTRRTWEKALISSTGR